MASERKPDRRTSLELVLDEEVAAILAADPEFKESLRQTVERVRRGEAELVEDQEVRRRLQALGVDLDDEPSPPDQPAV